MNEKHRQFVYEYWSKTERGRAMIASDSVSDSDLLFLIPNNVKRMHGLPLTRTCGKHKSTTKRNRKRQILSFKLFDLISEIIEMTLPKTYNEEFFNEFVDTKNVDMDYKYFKPSIRYDAVIPYNAPIIKINNIL